MAKPRKKKSWVPQPCREMDWLRPTRLKGMHGVITREQKVFDVDRTLRKKDMGVWRWWSIWIAVTMWHYQPELECTGWETPWRAQLMFLEVGETLENKLSYLCVVGCPHWRSQGWKTKKKSAPSLGAALPSGESTVKDSIPQRFSSKFH